MLFKEFKEKKLLKDMEEIVINRSCKLRGKEVLVLSLIKYGDSKRLWTLHKNTNTNEEYDFNFITNRDEFVRQIMNAKHCEHAHINEMNIQNKKITFNSSQGTSVEYACGNELTMIEHFIDSGLINEEWDNVNTEDMIFSSYEQCEEEDFPVVNSDENLEITLKLDTSTKEVLIQHPMKLKIGEYDKGSKIHYKDYYGKEDFFYIDEVVKYDIWKKTLEEIEENMKNIDEEYRSTYKEEYLNGVDGVCPREQDYTAIYYETIDNIQLRFISKEYLEKKPVYGSSSTSLLWLCNDGEGINGYDKCFDGIMSVEKDFEGELEVELFSKYINLPEEIVKL
ncbi:MAG: hypothetical protein ACRC92_00165 [Peptostreptococcaceae bacterium]